MIAAITVLALTTQIVLLGTGGEGPLSRRAGPTTAIVVDGRAYLVYLDPRITVTASPGGYRLQTADRTIVIRGDSSPSEAVVKQCNGCDVLIHEVVRKTCASSRVATRARPGLLILYSFHPDENELNRQMRNLYRGRFVVGHDLDVY